MRDLPHDARMFFAAFALVAVVLWGWLCGMI